jgi:hypothetical protein
VCGLGMRWCGSISKMEGSPFQASQIAWKSASGAPPAGRAAQALPTQPHGECELAAGLHADRRANALDRKETGGSPFGLWRNEEDGVFRQALVRYCGGRADEQTLALLERHAGRQPSKP